jgi:hypothetical protein
LDRLGERGQVDWSRASVDTMSVRAKRGGTTWAQIPSIVATLEASFTWSATAAVTAANVNDTTMLKAVMDDVPPGGPVGAAAHSARQAPRRQEL